MTEKPVLDFRHRRLPVERVCLACDRAVRDILPAAAFVLGAMYVLLGLAHRYFLPSRIAGLMSNVAFVSALVMVGIGVMVRRRELPLHRVHPVSMVLVALVLLNSALHLHLTGELKHTSNFMLLVTGLGFLLLAPGWYTLALLASLAGWFWAAAPLLNNGDGQHYAFAMGMSTLVSLVVFVGRYRLTMRVEALRLLDEQRQKTLEQSLRTSQASEAALSRLIEATRSLAQPMGLTPLLQWVLERLATLIPYDSAVILLGGSDTMTIEAWRGSTEPPAGGDLRIHLGEHPLLQDVFRGRQPVLVELQPLPAYWLTIISDPECKSWLVCPLFSGGTAVGLLILGSHKLMRYGTEELRLLSAFADYAASSIHNTLLVSWTQQALTRLSFLFDATRTLSTILDTDSILETLMDLAYKQIRPEAISIALAQPDGSLIFKAAAGGAGDKIIGMRVPKGKGLVGWVAQQGEPVWVPDVRNDPRFYGMVDKQTGFSTQSIYALPVWMGDEIVAVLEMINPQPETDINDLRDTMLALASLAASALQNARLFEQVRRAEQRYQNLFDLNIAPVLVFDAQGHLLEANRAARDMFGDALTAGESVFALLQLTPERFFQIATELASGQQPIWEMTLTQDHERRVLEAHITYLKDYGPQDAYQWMGHDVTERVRLAEMRSRLNHMIVHDLRNPLGVVRTSLEMLADCSPGEPERWEATIQLARRSLNHLSDLIDNMLDTARMAEGRTDIQFERVALAELLDEVEEAVRHAAGFRRQRLDFHLDALHPTLVANYSFLRRVLINLLDNAIKFSPAETTIELRVEEDTAMGMWRFSVIDQGPGIPPEEQNRIFEAYVRGEAQRHEKGVGLGLAFCKLAVEAHGGRIWVESAPGLGATFKFVIPMNLPVAGETSAEEQ